MATKQDVCTEKNTEHWEDIADLKDQDLVPGVIFIDRDEVLTNLRANQCIMPPMFKELRKCQKR